MFMSICIAVFFILASSFLGSLISAALDESLAFEPTLERLERDAEVEALRNSNIMHPIVDLPLNDVHVRRTSCQNCGAPIESNKCAYCGSVVQ